MKPTFHLWWWRMTLRLTPDALALTVARCMPRWLVYWCSIRLMAHATTGKWGNEYPSNVSMLQALDRWAER